MTGEREARPSRQPGGRPPAPGELGLLQSFVNTHFDLGARFGTEVLNSPAALEAWLVRAGLLVPGGHVGPADHEHALALREALRALARSGGAPARRTYVRLDGLAGELPLRVGFAGGAPRLLAPAGSGYPEAVGGLMAIATQAMLDGSWSRLKVCPGRHCGWLFYDHSRNRSGRWCSMSVCGGREKARAHYRRRVVAG